MTKETTLDDILDFLEQHMDSYIIIDYINTPISAFGNLSIMEYAYKHGFDAALGKLKRIWE